jgi:hypothetical protein
MDEEIITARILVEKERQRLIEAPITKKDFKEWLGDRTYPLEWMKKQFGETLTEKDGLTHPNGQRFYGADCTICKKEVESDEKVLRLSIETGEGFSIDSNICKECLKRMNKKLRDE